MHALVRVDCRSAPSLWHFRQRPGTTECLALTRRRRWARLDAEPWGVGSPAARVHRRRLIYDCLIQRTPLPDGGTGRPEHSGRGPGPLPQFTEIFFHKNVTDAFTPAPAEHLHHPLRPSLDVGFKERSPGKNELHALSFIVAVWPRKIQETFARRHPLTRPRSYRGASSRFLFAWLDAPMTKPRLDASRIVPVISECVAASMSRHVGVD
jgi:hypothetical protein